MAQWLAKNIELIDQYQPDVLWYDNGLNHRVFDPLKLKVAAYYYNRARQWGKPVTFTGKGTCFIAGGVQDFEGMGRAARERTDFTWMVHDTIAGSLGLHRRHAGRQLRARCSSGSSRSSARTASWRSTSRPRATVRFRRISSSAFAAIGRWLKVNGEAIYGTRPWTKSGEGACAWAAASVTPPGRSASRPKAVCSTRIVMAWPTDIHFSPGLT